MSAVTIRRLSPETHRALKARARGHGRSTEAEIRAILDAAVNAEGKSGIGTALKALGRRFRGLRTRDRARADPCAPDAVRVILVDTNVVSEPMRARGDPRVVAWLDRQEAADACSFRPSVSPKSCSASRRSPRAGAVAGSRMRSRARSGAFSKTGYFPSISPRLAPTRRSWPPRALEAPRSRRPMGRSRRSPRQTGSRWRPATKAPSARPASRRSIRGRSESCSSPSGRSPTPPMARCGAPPERARHPQCAEPFRRPANTRRAPRPSAPRRRRSSMASWRWRGSS